MVDLITMTGIRWTEDELANYLARYHRAPVPAAHVERHPVHAAQTKNARQGVDQKVCIRFHSKRRRLIDPDGLYSKAAIDGLTEGGLLIDDSAKNVASVSYSQEQSDVEETWITIETID